MLKLFDRDFFKFLIGFLFILIASFSIFYLLSYISDQAAMDGTASVRQE